VARKRLTAEEHHRRGTYQPVRHGDERASGMGVDPEAPETWLVNFSPEEQRLGRLYLENYAPGHRLAFYRFIAWQAACEASDYWRARRGDPPPAPEIAAHNAAHLADLFRATKWRRRR
jgi:hypothetical protein